MLGFLAGQSLCAVKCGPATEERGRNLSLDGGLMLTPADSGPCKIVLLLTYPKWYPSSHLWGPRCSETPVALAIFGSLNHYVRINEALSDGQIDIATKIRYGS
jgi:hypothetical protein